MELENLRRSLNNSVPAVPRVIALAVLVAMTIALYIAATLPI